MVKCSQSLSWQMELCVNDLQGDDIVEKGKFSQEEWVVSGQWETWLLLWGVGWLWKSRVFIQAETDIRIKEWSRENEISNLPGSPTLIKHFHADCCLTLTAVGLIQSGRWCQALCLFILYLRGFYWKFVLSSIILDSRDNKMEKEKPLISWRVLSKFEFFLIFAHFMLVCSVSLGWTKIWHGYNLSVCIHRLMAFTHFLKYLAYHGRLHVCLSIHEKSKLQNFLCKVIFYC